MNFKVHSHFLTLYNSIKKKSSKERTLGPVSFCGGEEALYPLVPPATKLLERLMAPV